MSTNYYIEKFNLKFSNHEVWWLLLSLLFIFLYNLPFFILGQDSYIGFGYDNLDSNVIWFKMLAESDKIFAANSAILSQPMGGLPRVTFPGELDFEFWLYLLFNPFAAYVVNIILIQIIAFFGMLLLLKYLYPNDTNLAKYLVALAFSCLPFWPHAGISIAGLPLLYFAYLNLKGKSLWPYLILVFYVLYSSFVLVGIFLIVVFALHQLIQFIHKKRKIDVRSLIFIFLLFVFYLITNYRLILSAINPSFVSHRAEFVMPTFGFFEAMKVFFKMVFSEYGHNLKFPYLIITLVVVWIFIALITKKFKIEKAIYQTIITIIFLAALSVFIQSSFAYNIYANIDFLKTIQLQRFYWLLPPLFYLLLYQVIREIYIHTKLRYILSVILVLHILFVSSKNVNFRQPVKTNIFHKEAGIITFNKFYSPDLYDEINQYIDEPQSTYRVASLGLQPAAAMYNGFYTIDGYFNNYPKAYKDKFYRIIEGEVAKNEGLKNHFQNFGSVCAIISDEMIKKFNRISFLIPVFYKNEGNIINNLGINTKAMKDLNCQYLFSAFKIKNSATIGLSLEKYFENDRSQYGIYLYSID